MANVNITKRAIQEAFLAVLNEKPLGKITVKDITDRCGINRNTFYYHYQDIPALLEEICQNQVEDIISKYPTLNSLSPEDRQLLIRYHKCECFGLILDWINNGLREDYVEGTRRLCQMRKGSVEDMIRRCYGES